MQRQLDRPRHSPAWYADGARWKLVGTELLITTAFLAFYFMARGIRPDDVPASVDRALQIVRIEQQLGVFAEATWQQTFMRWDFFIVAANFIYAWLHYPVMIAIGLWLVVKDPGKFRFIRNVLIVSALLGILAYWLLPTAPPRLLATYGYHFGFVDTVHGATSSVTYLQPGPFVNDYAALPSFHFGWIALCTAAIWINTSNRWVRAGAVAMSVIMWWAVVVTGNHFFFDMILGGLVVAFAWTVVALLERAPPLRTWPGRARERWKRSPDLA